MDESEIRFTAQYTSWYSATKERLQKCFQYYFNDYGYYVLYGGRQAFSSCFCVMKGKIKKAEYTESMPLYWNIYRMVKELLHTTQITEFLDQTSLATRQSSLQTTEKSFTKTWIKTHHSVTKLFIMSLERCCKHAGKTSARIFPVNPNAIQNNAFVIT